jgi:hypothetical protein
VFRGKWCLLHDSFLLFQIKAENATSFPEDHAFFVRRNDRQLLGSVNAQIRYFMQNEGAPSMQALYQKRCRLLLTFSFGLEKEAKRCA